MSYKSRFSRLSAGAKCPMFRAYSCSVSGVSKLPDAISLAVCSAGGMYSGCSSFVSGISGCTAGAMSVAALRLRSCFLARRLTLRIIPMYAQFTRVDVPPREIRGSGCPVTNGPAATNMFAKACVTMSRASPMARNGGKLLSVKLRAMYPTRSSNRRYSIITPVAPTSPSSSTIMA